MKSKFKVAILGYGYVGQAMHNLFPNALIINSSKNPVASMIPGEKRKKTLSYRDINKADVAFICVPTPQKKDGTCDTSIVEDVISKLNVPLIIIRSTIEPGTTDKLRKQYKKNIVFCPEYVGETVAHPLKDELSREFLILGGEKEDTRHAIEVFQEVYNASVKIRQMTSLEAEMVKYMENRHIAFTVAECNEIYDLCEKLGVDYNNVREGVFQDDPRMSPYWTFVYPKDRGFETKCIPKDIYAIAAFARKKGVPLKITETILNENEKWRAEK